ncbi:hypothetical protein [Nonomuraea sp. NPDC049784]
MALRLPGRTVEDRPMEAFRPLGPMVVVPPMMALRLREPTAAG